MRGADSRRNSSVTPHKSPAASSKAFNSGTVLDDRWVVVKVIGKGAFSEILAAEDRNPSEDMKERPYVAIKIQTACLDRSVLKWESSVVRDLSGHPCFPKFFSFHESTSSDDPEYIVMEYLCGEDMASIRNRARSKSSTGLVPLCLASYLVRDMIRGLREMHSRGYVHRDVKPSNFVRRDEKTTKFCVIDFGLTKMYRDSSGAIRPEKSHADFRGTTVYASPFVHDGFDQCPRDDLLSALHVFFDMVIGKLPWGDAARSKAKATVAAMKKHMYENPVEYIAWMREELLNKSPVGFEMNFSQRTQDVSLSIIEYLKNLGYDSTPDYDWLDAQLAEAVPEAQRIDVGDLNFSFDGFNWHERNSPSASFMVAAVAAKQVVDSSAGRLSSRPSVSTMATMPPVISYAAVDPNVSKLKSYATALEKLLRESTANLVTSTAFTGDLSTPGQNTTIDERKDIFKLALRWANVMKLVHQIPLESLTIDVMDIALRIVRRHQHFFGAYIEDDMPDRWEEFCSWQEMIGKTYEKYERISLALQSKDTPALSEDHGESLGKRLHDEISGDDANVDSIDEKRLKTE